MIKKQQQKSEGWEKRLERIVSYRSGDNIIAHEEQLKSFIRQELRKAREEVVKEFVEDLNSIFPTYSNALSTPANAEENKTQTLIFMINRLDELKSKYLTNDEESKAGNHIGI